MANKSERIIDEFIGNNATITKVLQYNAQYLMLVSYVAGGNINTSYVGMIACGQGSDKTGKITWLTSEPSGGVSAALNGATLTVTTPAGVWADLAIMKL